jgi:hypothetical protein
MSCPLGSRFLLYPDLIDVLKLHNCPDLLGIVVSHLIRITGDFGDCRTLGLINCEFSNDIPYADEVISGLSLALRLLGSDLFQRVACMTFLGSMSTNPFLKPIFCSPWGQFPVLPDMK